MTTETKNRPSDAPFTSEEFNKEYNSIRHWIWTDIRIPKELKELVKNNRPRTSLELGCGLGRFSTYMARQGVQATAVDFSAVAIERAKRRVADDKQQAKFFVGDVTNLEMLNEQFDVSFDVGCFHCLDKEGQKKYVNEVHRLLKPDATHLFWAMDRSPSDMMLTPDYVAGVFDGKFELADAKFSRRRIIASHWFWLVRK
ncbi:MAG: class I SAM-dependent methyltransferase [Planctomycetaceae bacterium]|jgi:cyclopropane fatty-acyl-phospholipid synthase-like methyltransferase|nr:class I SAM-dependent methyltransferase [Planctomycetaceae bacterium]